MRAAFVLVRRIVVLPTRGGLLLPACFICFFLLEVVEEEEGFVLETLIVAISNNDDSYTDRTLPALDGRSKLDSSSGFLHVCLKNNNSLFVRSPFNLSKSLILSFLFGPLLNLYFMTSFVAIVMEVMSPIPFSCHFDISCFKMNLLLL